MAVTERLNPTLFDKIVADHDISGLRDDSVAHEVSKQTMRHYSVPKLERFNEQAMRDTVKRELAWLLNTNNMESSTNLDAYPEVQTSVLNFGVPDFTGSPQPIILFYKGHVTSERDPYF